MPHELDTLTEQEKCRMVFRAVCEDRDCELTYGELEALRDAGFITKLRRHRANRWSFEWTDKLEAYAKAPTEKQDQMVRDAIADAS